MPMHHCGKEQVDSITTVTSKYYANKQIHLITIREGEITMNIDSIKKICILGAGNMGHQLALLAALNGYKVSCTDISQDQLQKAQKFAENWVSGRIAQNKLDEETGKKALQNLSFTPFLKEATENVDFVIEAATEILAIKRKLFRELDELCPKHTILATNSSFLPSSLVADVTNRPDKVCNMHFFNPGLIMKCVEVVKGPHTSEETAQITMELANRLNKKPVLLNMEIPGFIVNRIVAAISKEAFSLFDRGVASYEDIDSAIVNGLGHPMGPFRLADLTGIDLIYNIAMDTYRNNGDSDNLPSPAIVEKYIKGEWGQKRGKGFYNYNEKPEASKP